MHPGLSLLRLRPKRAACGCRRLGGAGLAAAAAAAAGLQVQLPALADSTSGGGGNGPPAGGSSGGSGGGGNASSGGGGGGGWGPFGWGKKKDNKAKPVTLTLVSFAVSRKAYSRVSSHRM